ncbi:hypothetical protein ACRRTK_018436 [Alexandromys fortis]
MFVTALVHHKMLKKLDISYKCLDLTSLLRNLKFDTAKNCLKNTLDQFKRAFPTLVILNSFN